MTRTEEQKRRRYLLRLLAERGPMTAAEATNAVQRNNFATPLRLEALRRFGLVAHDPQTDSYTISEHGMRRIGKSKTTNSPGTDGPTPTSVGAHGASTGGAGGHNVRHLDVEAERLVYEMEGAAGLARFVVRGEPDLWEALSEALDNGMAAPALLDVPRRKRVAAVEAHIADWQSRTRNGPCQCCGTRVAVPGYDAPSWADGQDEPGFVSRASGPSPLCEWCSGFLTAHDGSLALLRERVGQAIAGVVGVAAAGAGNLKFANSKLIPLAHELDGGTYGVVPWSHITGNAVLLRAVAMVAEQRVHPARFVRTEGQRAALAVPGIDTPLHAAPTRPASVAPSIVRSSEPTYRDLIRAAEQRHDKERADFLAAHPREFTGEERPWPAADAYAALLAKQWEELVAIDKRWKKRGRPTLGKNAASIVAAAR